MEPTKLCTACKYCHAHPELNITGDRLRDYNCFAPQNITNYSPVDGSPIFIYPHCVDLRVYNGQSAIPLKSFCGGSWWEHRPMDIATAKVALKSRAGDNLLIDLGM
jgi:hypothetical protein